jgi:hypothetical protein
MIATISPARAYGNSPKQSAWSGTEASMTETAQTKSGGDGKSISAIAMDRLESKGRTLESGGHTGDRFLRFLMGDRMVEYRTNRPAGLGIEMT